MEWTSVDLARELLLDNLHLQAHQTYFFSVEATNAAGLKSMGYTDGITVSITASESLQLLICLFPCSKSVENFMVVWYSY